MKINTKIAGIIFLLTLSAVILYLSVNTDNRQQSKIELIEVNGGSYISNSDYAAFAKLEDKTMYAYLNLSIIKDRIEKHPYIEKAEVKFEEMNKVSVRITERKLNALLIDGDRQVLLTENLTVIPYMPQTVELNLPVLSNAENSGILKYFTSAGKNFDIVTAFKIMDSFKFTNEELSENLSQIDLRNGRDILVYFSNMNFPVVFGRNDEIKKAVYFNNLWKFMKGSSVNGYLDYVDLRFEKHVYLGVTEDNSGNEEKQI